MFLNEEFNQSCVSFLCCKMKAREQKAKKELIFEFWGSKLDAGRTIKEELFMLTDHL